MFYNNKILNFDNFLIYEAKINIPNKFMKLVKFYIALALRLDIRVVGYQSQLPSILSYAPFAPSSPALEKSKQAESFWPSKIFISPLNL